MATVTRLATLVLLVAVGCGRVAHHEHRADAGPASNEAFADSGVSEPFACADRGGRSLRFRYRYRLDAEPLEDGRPPRVLVVRTAGEDVLVGTDRSLLHLSRDGVLLHRVPGDASTEIMALSPLATSALIRHGDVVDHVAANGEMIASLGPSAHPSMTTGILEANFSESGKSLVLHLGHLDREHDTPDAVEVRSLDGALIHRIEGALVGFVGNDDHTLVTASIHDVLATDDRDSELWRARDRSFVNILLGSRNARTVFMHSGAFSFEEGADNSGLLVVDGAPIVVPYLLPAGFSPDGTLVASRRRGGLTLLRDGTEVLRVRIAPELIEQSVSMNDRGETLFSGAREQVDAGVELPGHVRLYDVHGTLLARCDAARLGSLVYSAYSFDGRSFAVYGDFGVVAFDVE